ncbi:MAG TPA: hypothetical protein VF284_00940 [Rhodanobacteraceae bacterium]
MTAIAALAVCVMAVTIVLAIFALVSRHRAVLAQHEAVVAKQAAQRRQKQAEGLVNFMLGDLSAKLEQVDRLDIMQAVDDKAMAYFQSLPNTDVTPEALAQRAKALEKIGSVRLGLGNLKSALQAFGASAAISSKLAASVPANTKRQLAYSQTLAFMGMTHWQQGALEDAEDEFETGRRVLQSSLTHGTTDPALQIQLAYLDDDIGHVLEARGQPAAAAIPYQRMLGEAQKAAAAKADDIEYQVAIGNAHNNLGKLSLLRGDLATSITEYRADDIIETTLLRYEPRNNHQRENTLRVRAILGRTLALSGDTANGLRDLQQAVDMAARLTQFEPRDTDAQDYLALYSSQLATLQRVSGNAAAAVSSNAQAIRILVALTKKNPDNQGWQSDYAEALIEQAAELRTANQMKAARRSAQKAVDLLVPMLTKHPDERNLLLATMTAKLLLASMTTDAQSANAQREQALRKMQAAKTSRCDLRLQALQVEALLVQGRKVQARPLLKQLWSGGYRDPALLTALQRAHVDYPVNKAFQQRIATILHENHVNGPQLSYQARCKEKCSKSK